LKEVIFNRFTRTEQTLQPFTAGAFLGEVQCLIGEELLTTSVQAQRDGTVYAIPRKELVQFWDQNPGIQLAFLGTSFIDAIKQENHSTNTTARDNL